MLSATPGCDHMVVVLNASVSGLSPRVILGSPFVEISASAIEAAGSALTQGMLMPTVIQAVSQCIVPKCIRNHREAVSVGTAKRDSVLTNIM